MMRKLVIDVDTGVDDAQSIMMALAAPNVEVLGITCCHGNTTLDNSCKNTLRVLKACGRLDIPVYRGTAEALLGQVQHTDDYFGKDGLGDVPDPNAPGLDMLQKEGAVEAIIRMVNENPGEVHLVATAPLTNLALAAKMDPSFTEKIKGLYIMGGNTDSRGNITICGEFNFVADPEAAYIVLNRFNCPTYMATWEFTCYNRLPWSFVDTWLAQNTDKARFMKKISAFSMKGAKSETYNKERMVGGLGFAPCDSYAMAAFLEPDYIKATDQIPVTVELGGNYTRGMMVLDKMGLLKKTHKAIIMRKVDLDKFKKMLMDSLK